MASVNELISGIISREGGFVKHVDDPGGATRFGITEAVARRAGYIGHISELPEALARRIYREMYYEGPKFDQVAKLSEKIAEELTDTGVNMGVGVASTFLQRALNVLNQQAKLYPDLVVDGQLGPRSLAALNSYLGHRGKAGEIVMLKLLNCLQGARYVELAEKNPKLESFLYGWIANRVEI